MVVIAQDKKKYNNVVNGSVTMPKTRLTGLTISIHITRDNIAMINVIVKTRADLKV
ncbi:hypothetical protein D3C76_1646990 [compost metagenome]